MDDDHALLDEQPLLPRLIVGGLAGGAVAGAVNTGLTAALGPLQVGSAQNVMTVVPVAVFFESLVAGVFGAILLASCDPLAGRGRAFFLMLASMVLLVSFAVPIGTAIDTRTAIVLASMHVTTALAVLGGLWVALPRARRHVETK